MRVSWCGAVYLTAVAEYLSAEVLEISGNCAKAFKLKRINPRHILLSTRNDEELSRTLSNVTIPSAGVVPSSGQPSPAANRNNPHRQHQRSQRRRCDSEEGGEGGEEGGEEADEAHDEGDASDAEEGEGDRGDGGGRGSGGGRE